MGLFVTWDSANGRRRSVYERGGGVIDYSLGTAYTILPQQSNAKGNENSISFFLLEADRFKGFFLLFPMHAMVEGNLSFEMSSKVDVL
ncbi:hypothetical protein VTL71DRAFT_16002 [Oculimacula yallundae]|uniref:Uncharacterized protein n=1 Tax=Oculimacula yallundae TaxID=86028 RepID=A0ABR4CD89_9HELO